MSHRTTSKSKTTSSKAGGKEDIEWDFGDDDEGENIKP